MSRRWGHLSKRQMKAWDARQRQVGGRKPIHEALTYLENHHGQMRYVSLRAEGLPIGSGSGNV